MSYDFVVITAQVKIRGHFIFRAFSFRLFGALDRILRWLILMRQLALLLNCHGCLVCPNDIANTEETELIIDVLL